jgi:hypothetical protein
MKKLFLQLLPLMGIIVLFSCKGNSKSNQTTESQALVQELDAKAEITKWKQELLDAKQIGQPCTGDLASWSNQNPNQENGLPADENAYGSQKADVNGDGKQDLLIYFMSENCSGHNGGTPTYARLVYSDGDSYKINDALTTEVKNAILAEYNKLKESDKTFKSVSNNFLDETTTITGYENGVKGAYSLYAQDDAHCCPSYSGTYVYDVNSKSITIDNKVNGK